MQQVLTAFSRARSLGYTVEGGLLYLLTRAAPGTAEGTIRPEPLHLATIRRELDALLERDSRNITEGYYPVTVLKPESPWSHFTRIPRVMFDGIRIARRRKRGRTTEFTDAAERYLRGLPRYYRRAFHFQTDGYLSEESAALYEHQVEILFLGAGDPMRRLIIPPLKRRFGHTDGRGLRILEIGCGTGRATRFVKLAFPEARITAVDLSEPYLKVARQKLSGFEGIDWLQADGAELPFRDGQFDAVYSVFLFHELPLEERRKVIQESLRVAKPGALVGLVDSVQDGEIPDLDPILKGFPTDFHEPYYRNYLENPMEELLGDAGLAGIRSDRGYLSKVCWGNSP